MTLLATLEALRRRNGWLKDHTPHLKTTPSTVAQFNLWTSDSADNENRKRMGSGSGADMVAAREGLSGGNDEVVFGRAPSPILEPVFGIGLEIE